MEGGGGVVGGRSLRRSRGGGGKGGGKFVLGVFGFGFFNFDLERGVIDAFAC